MFKSFSMDLAGRKLTVEVGRVAAQANGAAFMHYGDTVVLSTATASAKPREGIDFFKNISTNCTKAAITRINTIVCKYSKCVGTKINL